MNEKQDPISQKRGGVFYFGIIRYPISERWSKVIMDFKSFLESMHNFEGWLLCIFFKSQASGLSTQKPVPQSENDVVFEDFIFVNGKLTFEDVIKKTVQLSLDWDFVATSTTESNRTLAEIKEFLADMRNKLNSGFKMFAIFDREGFFINPSKYE